MPGDKQLDKGCKNCECQEVEIVGGKLYRIEEIAKKTHMSESSLRRYVRLGLVTPAKREKGCYLLGESSIFRIAKIRRLRRDLGVNLAGIGLVLDLLERIEDLDRRLSELRLGL